MYVDDVYVDITQARIEIANCPDFANCLKSEVQIPISWEPFSLSFKANIASFAVNEPLYLFVIDKNGIVSNTKRVN
jgi:hypothetical protein